MIDDKKIEEATRNYINKNGYFIKYDEEPCIDIEFAYKEGYKEGCKDAINEFLKDLWHPASEKPVPVMGCNNGVLVELNETKKPITLWKREYLYENISKHGNRFISRWLYIDDLLPKEGDKQ